MSESMKGQWWCTLAMVLVGSTVVVSKLIGQDVEPFLATALRHAAALPVFLLLLWWRGEGLPGWGAPRPNRHDTVLLVVQAAAGSVGYTVLLIQGVSLSSAADAGIVAGTLPAMSALLSALLLGERPGARMVLSIVLASAGVMVVTASPGDTSASPTRLLGIVLVLAAVACEAVFILANKRLVRPIAALPLSTLMCAGGLLMSALPAAALYAARPSTLSGPALGGIVYYAWGPTVIGFVLWYAGSARTSGTRAALSTVWLPVSALLLSALVLGETIRPWQWVGLGCVVAAMVLAGTGQAPRREASSAVA